MAEVTEKRVNSVYHLNCFVPGAKGMAVTVEKGQQGPKGDTGAKGNRGPRGDPGPEGMM